MTPSESSSPETDLPTLSLWDTICLIIGIIIGASIYQAPPEIFRNVSGWQAGMIAWGIGGIVSLVGALCYAELASTWRTAGGDYTWLTLAYGRWVGFFFAWAELAVIRTGGSIAFMAYVFANYAHDFLPLGFVGEKSRLMYALMGIIALTFVNAIGVRPGRVVQNALTLANLVGLIGVVLIGIWCAFSPVQPVAVVLPPVAASVPMASTTSFALAMVLIFYAYGGWNEAAFLASEVRNPARNVQRALIYGTLTVTLIYMLVNSAYISALGYRGVCSADAVAGDMFAIPFGETGRKAIAVLVMISALGSVNGLLFTGMRLYGTFGRDHALFKGLARKDDGSRTAHGALFAQAAFSLLLILIVETASDWRQLLSRFAEQLGLVVHADFHNNGGIYKLVTCTAPVFWLFFLLTGISLFVLRRREPDRERPFRVPLYPILPLIFVGSCAFMLYRSTAYAVDQEPAEAFVVLGLLSLAVPLAWISGRMDRTAVES